ncbi:MAG: NAD(P)H-dependent oxidoreductase subunit E, partial [Candidatus Hydrogenedentes bacterium]|nr:NAD(P)H-dependent oxidoreductase subunit E [Candidatus Hydrogenedentota bacterium]
MLKTKIKTDDSLDLSRVDEIVAETGRDPQSVLPILQAIQKAYRYLPRPALERVCDITEITPADIEGVSTFFSQFRHTPMGQHVISVCDGTACHVKGSLAVHDAVMQTLNIKDGGDTDDDGLFTVRKVACLGCCTLAPAVQIDGVTYGHVRTDTVSHMLHDFLENESRRARHGPSRPVAEDGTEGEIRIGLGSCCVASGSGKIQQALEEALSEIQSGALVKHVGCIGMCHRTPLVEIVQPNELPKLYARVDAEDIPRIVSKHFTSRNPIAKAKTALIRRLESMYTDSGRDALERYSIDVRDEPVAAFLNSQRRLATEHCGVLNPTDLDEYKRLGGFTGLAKCLSATEPTLSPAEIIEEVTRSGLRGRGGAGFPTGRKWSIVRDAPGDVKYIICNGDEGDP